MVTLFLTGYNQTIFAYGQTGSGKTFTIEGTNTSLGLLPRIINDVYRQLDTLNQQSKIYTYTLACQCLQIYNEKIFDMFQKDLKPLKLKWEKNEEFAVENLTSKVCREDNSMQKAFKEAQKHRITCSHLLNESSSRSHQIFNIKLERTNLQTTESFSSSFYLVDLAGAERANQTKATGQQLIECAEINKSLFTLRFVITALAEKQKHVPYRDSKLTSLLKQSLAGNSYSLMVLSNKHKQQFQLVCVSPSNVYASQTYQSLVYGAKAQSIQIQPMQNLIIKDAKSKQIELLRKEIVRLQNELRVSQQQNESLNKIIENLKNQSKTCENLQQINNFVQQSASEKKTKIIKSNNVQIQNVELLEQMQLISSQLNACMMENQQFRKQMEQINFESSVKDKEIQEVDRNYLFELVKL